MWIIDKIVDLISRDATAKIDSIENHSRMVSHDLTNVAARLDVLSRLHKNMYDDTKYLNGNGVKRK
jgi:hypothetical protein